jgi:hypothetical protein
MLLDNSTGLGMNLNASLRVCGVGLGRRTVKTDASLVPELAGFHP